MGGSIARACASYTFFRYIGRSGILGCVAVYAVTRDAREANSRNTGGYGSKVKFVVTVLFFNIYSVHNNNNRL